MPGPTQDILTLPPNSATETSGNLDLHTLLLRQLVQENRITNMILCQAFTLDYSTFSRIDFDGLDSNS